LEGLNENTVITIFKKLIRPFKERIAMLATRVVIMAVDDSKKIQMVQLSAFADEDLSDIERFQNFAFTSNPPVKSEGLMISLGGNRGHNVVIALDNRDKRPTGLKSGESAHYFNQEHYIALREGGKIQLKNKKHDLVKIHTDLVQAIIDARTLTLGGVQPLLNAKDPFAQIKRRYETFLKE
jgi:phage baseplate assembly protein V